MLHDIVAAVVGALAFIGLLFGAVSAPAQVPASDRVLGAALPSGTAVFETSLQSRITSTDTTMTLVANSVRGGTTLSGYQCFTVDEGRTDAEYICGTISGTSVTGLVRGIDPQTGTTTNSALKFAHRVGANVKITDFPILQILRNQANGADTYPNVLRYASGVTPASGSDLTDYEFVTGLAFSGAGIVDASTVAKGVVELATQQEAASSTSQGDSGALVVSAATATSTYNSGTAAYRIPVTDSTGKLDGNFLPTIIPNDHTFSGNLTVSGTATTTFASSSIQAYTSSTTPSVTWTKPANLKYVRVQVQSQGGIGGATSCGGGCLGGGAGGWGWKIIPAAALGATETVVVGGVTAIPTSFGSHITCTAAVANAPGTCTGADFTISGQPGGNGIGGISSTPTGGGAGGDSVLGRGGQISFNISATSISNSVAGTGYGSGSSGCADAIDGTPACNTTGANPGTGAIIVEQFFY